MLLHSNAYSRHQILDDAMMSVKKALRRGKVLEVSNEARRLLRSHPDCGHSVDQLENTISLMAARLKVRIAG